MDSSVVYSRRGKREPFFLTTESLSSSLVRLAKQHPFDVPEVRASAFSIAAASREREREGITVFLRTELLYHIYFYESIYGAGSRRQTTAKFISMFARDDRYERYSLSRTSR